VTDTMTTFREYISERWRSTDPGLRWAYVLSIIAAILFVPYSPGAYLWIGLLLIPVTICSFIQGGLRLRLLWLGFLLFDVKQIFNLAIHYDFIFGIRLNDYIAFPMIFVVLIRGFLSFDLKKTADIMIEKGPFKLVSGILILFILVYATDLAFPLSVNGYDTTISGTSSTFLNGTYILVCAYLLVSITAKEYFGSVLSIILIITGTLDCIAFLFLRIEYDMFSLLDRLSLISVGLRYICKARFAFAFILPIMATMVIILFLRKIQDTVIPREKSITRRK
jgi:hypothetical protein